MLLKSYSVNWLNFSVLLHLLQELSGNMYIVIVCYSFCLHDQKFRMKTEISQEWKDLFRRNEKRFLQDFQFQFLQDFQFQFLQDFQCVFNTVSLLHSLQSRRALLRHISLFRRNTIGNFKRKEWFAMAKIMTLEHPSIPVKGTLMQMWKSPNMFVFM